MPRKDFLDFYLTPMRNTMVDYTWRTHGRDMLKCPRCGRHGTPRLIGAESFVVHRELVSDYDHEQFVEACSVPRREIDKALTEKKKNRELARRTSKAKYAATKAKRLAAKFS